MVPAVERVASSSSPLGVCIGCAGLGVTALAPAGCAGLGVTAFAPASLGVGCVCLGVLCRPGVGLGGGLSASREPRLRGRGRMGGTLGPPGALLAPGLGTGLFGRTPIGISRPGATSPGLAGLSLLPCCGPGCCGFWPQTLAAAARLLRSAPSSSSLRLASSCCCSSRCCIRASCSAATLVCLCSSRRAWLSRMRS